MTISQHLRFTSGEFTTALARTLGLVIPQLLTAVGMPLSNNTNSARKVGDAFGHAYTTVTGANGDHVRTFHETVLAYLFDEFKAAGIFFRGGPENSTKNTISHCISQNLTGRDNIELVVGRFGEFSRDFAKMRDYIARQKAYA